MSIEQTTDHVIIPSSPADRQKMKSMITEMTYCMQRIDDEKSAMKDIAAAIEEQFDLPKKHVNKLAKTLYKRNYETLQAENEDFETLYESILETKTVGE